MINKKGMLIKVFILLLIVVSIVLIKFLCREKQEEYLIEIAPHYGTITNFIATTGTVLPRNRLEIKPPINGRVDTILVREGQYVRQGQVLIWMSSMERAALIDSARTQGRESLKYWEEAYKPIPLVAPIRGTVIVRSVEPGQTVDSNTAIIVLSDRLIVKADVDETDIGRIRVGQGAVISLDAYPDVKVKGRVSHISYESKIINNVTMYEVDVMPDTVPQVFRSGMSANVNIIAQQRENVLVVPVRTLMKENDKSYLLVRAGNRKDPEKRYVEIGISDGESVEIRSGLGETDAVLFRSKKYKPQTENSDGANPFLPFRKRK